MVVGEAALAADLITAWETLRGGCASSSLDHGFHICLGEAELTADLIAAAPKSPKTVRKGRPGLGLDPGPDPGP